MRTQRRLVNILPLIAAIALAMLLAAGNLNLTNASGSALSVKRLPALAMTMQEESGPVHRPLATVGVTLGQTVRINVVSSPDPNSSSPPGPVTVEMCFHDTNGNLVLDRSAQTTENQF